MTTILQLLAENADGISFNQAQDLLIAIRDANVGYEEDLPPGEEALIRLNLATDVKIHAEVGFNPGFDEVPLATVGLESLVVQTPFSGYLGTEQRKG